MRRRYLVGYDIAEPRRLRRVGKEMKGWGYRIQFSVFLCDLNGIELVQMRQSLKELINERQDSVFILDLGEVSRWDPRRVETLGLDKGDQPDDPMVF